MRWDPHQCMMRLRSPSSERILPRWAVEEYKKILHFLVWAWYIFMNDKSNRFAREPGWLGKAICNDFFSPFFFPFHPSWSYLFILLTYIHTQYVLRISPHKETGLWCALWCWYCRDRPGEGLYFPILTKLFLRPGLILLATLSQQQHTHTHIYIYIYWKNQSLMNRSNQTREKREEILVKDMVKDRKRVKGGERNERKSNLIFSYIQRLFLSVAIYSHKYLQQYTTQSSTISSLHLLHHAPHQNTAHNIRIRSIPLPLGGRRERKGFVEVCRWEKTGLYIYGWRTKEGWG